MKPYSKRRKHISKKQIKILQTLADHSQGLTIFELKRHINPTIRQRELTYTRLVKEGLIKEIWGKRGVGLHYVLSAKGFDALKAQEEHLEEKKRLA